jgi:hypothetical protein
MIALYLRLGAPDFGCNAQRSDEMAGAGVRPENI